MSLTEKQKTQLKNYSIYALMLCLAAGILYYIFVASSDKVVRQEFIGANTSFPQGEAEDLPEDKLKAYRLRQDIEKEKEFQNELDRELSAIEAQAESRMPMEEDIDWQEEASIEVNRHDAASELRGMAMSFQNEMANRNQEREDAMQAEINALKEELLASKKDKGVEDIERRTKEYMEQVERLLTPKDTTPPPPPVRGPKLQKVKAYRLQKKVVSSLQGEAFLPENQFHSPADIGMGKTVQRNTINVSVEKTIKVKPGDFVRLRLDEPIFLEELIVPKNALIVGKASIHGTRMQLAVTSIEYKGRIVEVNLTAFDLDGQEGISIPNSIDREAVKEAAAEMSGTVGQNYTISRGITDQLVGDAARTVMSGASKYLQKKISAVRVELKAGYRLLLVENKN